jgi:hypothetical protein
MNGKLYASPSIQSCSNYDNAELSKIDYSFSWKLHDQIVLWDEIVGIESFLNISHNLLRLFLTLHVFKTFVACHCIRLISDYTN